MSLNRLKELIQELNKATEFYDLGKPIMSDSDWDTKYFELKTLEDELGFIYPNSPTQKIHYNIVSELEKVKHNHLMLSLDKTKDWDEFKEYFKNHEVITMLKLDGLTCSLRYENGLLTSAETRGNGVEGENIFHNAQIISNIPKMIPYKEELIVDGEVLCTYKDFELFNNTYSNPRNFAAGSIRLLDSAECEKRNLKFVVWDVIKGFEDNNSFKDKLKNLQKLGFSIVPWATGTSTEVKDFLLSRAEEESYPIDGIVGRFDDIKYGYSLGRTDHHNKAAYAFKFYDELYETQLKDIEWSMGRTGQITPIAVFEPVLIDNAIINKASLHNLSIMNKTFNYKKPWKGQNIKIYRSNMIIPQVDSAEEITEFEYMVKECLEIPTVCPICGEELIESNTGGTTFLYCANDLCEGKLINILDHACSRKALNIKGLSKATLEKIIEWNWVNCLSDIFILKNHREEWVKKTGFGPKSVDNILTAIDNCLQNSTLEDFLTALGIPLIGRNNIKKLIEQTKIKTFEEFYDLIKNNYTFSQLDGFGIEKELSILGYNYDEALKLRELFNFKELENNELEDNRKIFINKVFAITGKLNHYKNRNELKAVIEKFGGKVVDSVSSKISYLINNDKLSESSKNKKAKSLGIPIVTEEEFIDFLKNL